MSNSELLPTLLAIGKEINYDLHSGPGKLKAGTHFRADLVKQPAFNLEVPTTEPWLTYYVIALALSLNLDIIYKYRPTPNTSICFYMPQLRLGLELTSPHDSYERIKHYRRRAERALKRQAPTGRVKLLSIENKGTSRCIALKNLKTYLSTYSAKHLAPP